jgi:prepilin-type N-terminal cleavage/methylation domain-containing protein
MERRAEQGFTLIEMFVVLIVGSILIGVTVSTFQQYMKIYQRQQRVILVERELSSIQLGIGQALTTMPGREVGYFSGSRFSVPELPLLERGGEQIRLGLVTPTKIASNDAITVIYGRRKYSLRNEPCESVQCLDELPRMELAEASREVLGKGVARVALFDTHQFPFNTGDMLLMVGVEAGAVGKDQSVGRLVRLEGPPRIVKSGRPLRDLMEFEFNFCESGRCGAQFPQLINSTGQKIFSTGSVLVPVNVITFYLSKANNRSLVVRNDGGSIFSSEDGKSFQIAGGVDSILGEADSLKISYLLLDDTERPTPAVLPVDWLNQIKAVRVELNKTLPLPVSSSEFASRTLNVSFPIAVTGLD